MSSKKTTINNFFSAEEREQILFIQKNGPSEYSYTFEKRVKECKTEGHKGEQQFINFGVEGKLYKCLYCTMPYTISYTQKDRDNAINTMNLKF